MHMNDRHIFRDSQPSFSKKLIMVIEQDEQIGTQFVQLIQHETSFQAILATSLHQVRNILAHLHCDLFVLTDEAFPEEDLERLCRLLAGTDPPTLFNLTFLSSTYDYHDHADVKNVVKAVNLLLSLRDKPACGAHPVQDQKAAHQLPCTEISR